MDKPSVAVIIAVSNYEKLSSLPACMKDAEVVKAIVLATGKFLPDNILLMDTDTTSSRVKADLAKFLDGIPSDVGELLFYYSGHGLFNDEFHFLFTDYNEGNPRQTSLTNSELDNMLRSKNPSLAVKIVDACQSGQEYVKSRETFEKAIRQTSDRYNMCYFLFSSNREQSSYANEAISHFTDYLARGISSHKGDTIRYKDIIDYLADRFDSNADQQPFFVTQARHTEVFCHLTDPIRESIRKLLPDVGAAVVGRADITLSGMAISMNGAASPVVSSLANRLKAAVENDAAQYCSQEEAFARYDVVLETVKESRQVEPLDACYTLKVTPRNECNVPDSQTIGEWARANQTTYFVKPTYSPEQYETWQVDPPPPSIWASLSGTRNTHRVTKTRHVVAGIESTIETPPYKSVLVEFIPTTQNLPWWNLWLVVVNSKTHMRIFYALAQLRELNWTNRSLPTKVEWRVLEAAMKDETAVRSMTQEILNQLACEIRDQLSVRFKVSETPQ